MENGVTITGFYRSHKSYLKYWQGMSDDEIIDLTTWKSAVNIFWGEVLQVNLEEAFKCKKCKNLPPVRG